MFGVDEQVDPGMAIAWVVFLRVLDAADDSAVELDREADAVASLDQPLVDGPVRVPHVPPSCDSGLREDPTENLAISGMQRTQMDELAAEKCGLRQTRASRYRY